MGNPVIIFRTEGGHKLGLGHIKRCLNLADFLAKQFPIHPLFILSPSDISLKKLFQGRPYEILQLEGEEGPELLEQQCLERHPRAWITDLRKCGEKNLFQGLAEKHEFFHIAIDDMHLSEVQAHVTINPSIVPCDPSQHSHPQGVYHCGAEYFFHFQKPTSPAFPKKKGKRVLVSMGGSDPDRVTERLWKAFCDMAGDVEIHMVIGPAFAWGGGPLLSEKNGNIVGHQSPEELAPLISSADLTITGGGLTLYESIRLGIPTITIPQNPFELKTAKAFQEKGVALQMGLAHSINTYEVVSTANSLLKNDSRRREMSRASMGMFLGEGAEKVKTLLSQVLANIDKAS